MLVLLASIMTLILHRAMCSRLEAAEGGRAGARTQIRVLRLNAELGLT